MLAAPPPTNPAPASAAATAAPDAAPKKGGGMQAMVGDKLDSTLTKVGASDDQKTRIKGIMLTALGQLMALQPEVKQAPKAFEHALTGTTVDRAALEQARVQMMSTLDQGSKILVQALGDAAASLTPEQRVKLATLLAGKPKEKTEP